MWNLCSSQIFLRGAFLKAASTSLRANDETEPFSNALRINVLDAFSSGGAQNRSEKSERNYDFSSMLYAARREGDDEGGPVTVNM